jgi:hypothetical protein
MTSEMPELPATNLPPSNRRAELKYRHKTSFYQDEADAKRMRAVFKNTMRQTGYNSLSDFINAAVDDKVAALEHTYNDGRQWAPLGARENPPAKPPGRPAAVLNNPVAPAQSGGPTPPLTALVTLAGKIRADLTARGSNVKVYVFYSDHGREALVIAHDVDSQLSAVHSIEISPNQNSIFIRTAEGVGWTSQPGWHEAARETPPALDNLRWPEAPGAELLSAVDQAREELESHYSKPLEGHIGVFYRDDGNQALLERFDAGEQMSALRIYGFDPSNGNVKVRKSDSFSWEDGEDVPINAV